MVIESHDASVDIIGSEPEKWKPQSRETADHSLPYITAVALIDGEITDRQFEPARFTEPGIVKFLENVKVKRNDELSALYAEAVANIVHVELTDGRTLTKRVDYPLGNAKNRLRLRAGRKVSRPGRAEPRSRRCTGDCRSCVEAR